MSSGSTHPVHRPHGMNTFLYGPKDDPLVRRRWREPYDEAVLTRLRELVDRPPGRGVDVRLRDSPGLSIRYSWPRTAPSCWPSSTRWRPLGVTRFGLLLDDMPPDLRTEDRAVYPDLETAHAALAMSRPTRAGSRLVVCPRDYQGRGDEPYLRHARRGGRPRRRPVLDRPRDLLAVARSDDARRFAETAGRPPLYWDNYPVNDVAMGFELHVGPYLGRDAGSARSRGASSRTRWSLRSVEDPPSDDRRLPGRSRGYDPEASSPARSARSRATTPRRSRRSRTTSEAAASRPTTRRSSGRARGVRVPPR